MGYAPVGSLAVTASPPPAPATTDAATTYAVVVAVDGTSGSGKSSTSRLVASRLGARYLDTGAQFRAIAWWMLREGVDVADGEAVARRSEEPGLVSGTDPAGPTIVVDGHDVARAVRLADVTAAVSPVSTVPAVRARLLLEQRRIIEDALGEGRSIVVEGRDIGSVVWPDAALKVFLTADPAARAARRAAEEGGSDAGGVEASLRERDRIDSGRTTAPLVRADGAVEVDTTTYTLDEVVDLVVSLLPGLLPAGQPDPAPGGGVRQHP